MSARAAKSSGRPGEASRPVVVWNCTRRCNLDCVHCYSASTTQPGRDELTGPQAEALIDDLAEFGCPVLLLSGGEPLMRDDIFALVSRARAAGMRAVISTNGTLITPSVAERLADAGLNYAGVSLDGLTATNDRFRGRDGAFAAALAGVRNCRAAGLKIGLRLTMTAYNYREIPAIFDLVEAEGIPRVCFYHLVGTGRGEGIASQALTGEQTRRSLDVIMDRTAGLIAAGRHVDVLTVDNHPDGPYVYMRLARSDPAGARRCMELLRANGGNSSGRGIACVSWNGDVLPDQFWRTRAVGNVRSKSFGQIWSDPACTLLGELRDRKGLLTGRCRRCRWLEVCNGNLRARAEAAGNGPWGDDPACYLTDEEIA